MARRTPDRCGAARTAGGQAQASHDRPLGGAVTIGGLGGRSLHRDAHRRVPDLVSPGAAELEVVVARVVGVQQQRGTGDLGRRERVVGGDDARRGLEPRVVRLLEPGQLRRRDLDPLPGQRHLLQLRRDRLDRPGQLESPADAFAAALGLGPVGVDQAMALGSDEGDHRDGRQLAVQADLRGDRQRPGRVGAGQVQAELRAAVPVQRAEAAAANQPQAERGRLVQQRPELARLEGGQVDRLVVAVPVAVGEGLVAAGPVDRVDLLEQLGLGRRPAVVAVLGVQLGPAQ